MSVITINAFPVPSTALAALATTSQSVGGDPAQVIPILQSLSDWIRPPLSEQEMQNLLAQYTTMSDPTDWGTILAGFLNAATATTDGLSTLQSFMTKQYSSVVLMFIANTTGATLSLDPTDDSGLYCGHGDPLFVSASIPDGSVGAFLFGSSAILDANEGVLVLNGLSGGYGFIVGWYDPHSGDNGCLFAAGDDAKSFWEMNAPQWSATVAIPNEPPYVATAAVSATSGSLVTITVNIASTYAS